MNLPPARSLSPWLLQLSIPTPLAFSALFISPLLKPLHVRHSPPSLRVLSSSEPLFIAPFLFYPLRPLLGQFDAFHLARIISLISIHLLPHLTYFNILLQKLPFVSGNEYFVRLMGTLTPRNIMLNREFIATVV